MSMTTAAPPTILGRFLALWEPGEKGCWLWIGAQSGHGYRDRDSYGGFWNGRKYVRAHRFAYEFFIGPVPSGKELDHLCFVRHCVNPSHLEAVTRAENMRRAHARITHCPRGHIYDEKNTGYCVGGTGRKARVCRQCAAAYQRRLRASRKERV